MRILYLMVGAPGSGKSTFIKEHHLEDITIEPDYIRKLTGATNFNWDADTDKVTYGISMVNDNRVWDLLYTVVEKRMKDGQTLAIDATFLFKHAFTKIKHLRDKYHYRVITIDMRHQTTGITFEQLQQQNNSSGRKENGKVVSKKVLRKYWKRETNLGKLPRWQNPITVEQFKQTTYWFTNLVNPTQHTYVFGDIHGSYDVLMTAIRELGDPKENPDDIYIFVGDYLDRGTQNDKVFKWLYDRLDLKNMVFLRGNHERHWLNFVNGEKVANRDTYQHTIPQLMSNGITKEMIDKFVHHLQDMYSFTYPGYQPWLVTHAGLPWEVLDGRYNDDINATWKLNLLPEKIAVDGIGKFEMDVDKHNLNHSFQQIHGHRNNFFHDPDYNPRCLNLEQRVEMGGHLAVAVFTNGKGNVHLYKNGNFNPSYLENNPDVDIAKLSDEQINIILKNSMNIRNKKVKDGLWANNFTRDAFAKGRWNKFSITARGLFTTDEGNIAMRGFSKFFNFQEVPGTSFASLEKHPFPATVTEKYDGFLTLIGLYQDKLQVFSKGGEGPASEVANNTILKAEREKIEDWLKQHLGVTVLCECINPNYDTHMVKYDKPVMKVIEVVTNEYSSKDKDDLADEFANLFTSFERVKKLPDLKNVEDLRKLISKSYQVHNKDNFNHEGYVVRFNDGFRFKLKNMWYQSIKETKHMLERVNNSGDTENQLTTEYLKKNQYHGNKPLTNYFVQEIIKHGIPDVIPTDRMTSGLNMIKLAPYLFESPVKNPNE